MQKFKRRGRIVFMKKNRQASKRRADARKARALGDREILDLRKLLDGTDPDSPPSILLRKIKTSDFFKKSSYAEGGAIRLVARSGHSGIYTRQELGQIAYAS